MIRPSSILTLLETSRTLAAAVARRQHPALIHELGRLQSLDAIAARERILLHSHHGFKIEQETVLSVSEQK